MGLRISVGSSYGRKEANGEHEESKLDFYVGEKQTEF